MAGTGTFTGGGGAPAPAGSFVGGGQLDAAAPSADPDLDKWSGAPANVRNIVGGATTPRDRLSTLRKFYPDAQPVEHDNFVFTDPATKRLTLYNPPGIDLGDLASVGPEIAETAGGIVGGALAAPAAVVGAPATAGASALLVPAGIGLGAAAGREVENWIARAMGRDDTRGVGRRLLDTAVTTGTNAVGQSVADLGVRGVRALVGPSIRRLFTHATAPELLHTFARQEVDPMAGAVSGSRAVQIIEHTLANTPGGASTMQRATERTVGQLGDATNRISAAVGNQGTPQITGEALRTGAEAAGERFAARRDVLDQAVEAAIGARTPVPMTAVTQLRTELQGELARAPAARQADLGRAIRELTQLEADAAAHAGPAGGQVDFGTLRAVRRRIGRELDRPDVSGYTPGEGAAMNRVYGALATDIHAAADAAGPDAARALSVHDRYVRYVRSINLPVLDELTKLQAPEQIYNWAIAGGKDGGTRLAKLRYNFRTEYGEPTWDELVSTVVDRMGRATPGKQGAPTELLGKADTFSPDSFLTSFAKLSPEAKDALFGGPRYAGLRENLGDVVSLSAALKDAEKMANPSGSGRVIMAGALFGALGFAGHQLMSGDVVGAAENLGSTVVAPYIAARLITNPRFARWLASTRSIGTDPNSLARHLGRLAVIAEGEPAIRDEVQQYEAALRRSPALAAATGASAR